eukprot:symbB.v1.2.033486.t1/scaffold4168.1/size43633/1
MQEAEIEVQRHKARAEAAEKERDLHAEVAKRQEDNLKHRREEVNEHLQQLERQQQEMSSLLSDVKKQSEAVKEHRLRANELEKTLASLRSEVLMRPFRRDNWDGEVTGNGYLEAVRVPSVFSRLVSQVVAVQTTWSGRPFFGSGVSLWIL